MDSDRTSRKGVAIVNKTSSSQGITFPSEDGNQWLDLTGNGSNNTEGVTQTVATVQGQTYTLTFWVGNVAGGASGIFSSICLKIDGVPVQNFTNSTPSKALNWQRFTYAFVATGSTTAIEFDNLDPTGDNANGLDNVDLEEGGTASPPPVNLITNGDFETPIVPTGVYTNFDSGSTGITGWTVTGSAPNTVAVVSGALVDHGTLYASAPNGHQWLDLTGTGVSSQARGIMQTVSTTAGTIYRLSFWVGNAYDPGGDLGITSTVGLKINGTSAGSFENVTRTMVEGLDIESWQQFNYTFTASGSSTTIEFDNLDPSTDSCNGLDNVILQQIGSANPSLDTTISASAFGGYATAAPGSWIEIYGSDLASDTRSWGGSDFHGVNAPTMLDGTSVTVGGQSAFVYFISPTQVNALVPSGVAPGLQQVTVTIATGAKISTSLLLNPLQPGVLAPSSFIVNGTQYAVAQLAEGTYALPTGAIAGINSRPAKPGETIVIYGVGFGAVTPDIPAGQTVQQSNTLASSFQMSIGGTAAATAYAGLAPNYTGLYQFNVTVPIVAAGDAVPLTFSLGGLAGSQTLNIAVGN